jgi:RNA polymerase-binding transcription factor DksA
LEEDRVARARKSPAPKGARRKPARGVGRKAAKKASRKASAGSSRKPAKASRKPAKPARKPARKPAKSSRKPAKSSRKPAKTSRKPAKSSRKPAKAVRKPAKTSRKPAQAARKPARKPAKSSRKTAKPARRPAQPAKSPRKPAKPSRKPAKASRKPARGPARRARKPAPVSILASVPDGPVRPAKLPVGVTPRKEAAKGFQREYRKWLQRLIALRHRLLADGHVLEEEGLRPHESDVRLDGPQDVGAEGYEEETTLALLESNSDALREVDDAIHRIEVLTYGRCQECQKMIRPARLAVLPHARHCIECQSALERQGY